MLRWYYFIGHHVSIFADIFTSEWHKKITGYEIANRSALLVVQVSMSMNLIQSLRISQKSMFSWENA